MTSPDSAPTSPQVFSVAEFGQRLKLYLERRTHGLFVGGELVSLKQAASGHLYFTLRDPDEDACLECVMYRSASMASRRALCEGQAVIVRGYASFLPSRSRSQFVAIEAKLSGEGDLAEKRRALIEKLRAEGLFAPERKRPIPSHPRVVGVVTSGQGAAIHDIIRVAHRRGAVRLVLAHAAVQGVQAADAILKALSLIEAHPEVEVVILSRGGGASEDLAAFQDERVVRRVAALRVPVVSAVGHETDVTLVDWVSDLRASTPSQAAEIVVADEAALLREFTHLETRLKRAAARIIDERGERLDHANESLQRVFQSRRHAAERRHGLLERGLFRHHPRETLRHQARAHQDLERALADSIVNHTQAATEELAGLHDRLVGSVRSRLRDSADGIARAALMLNAMSPLAVIARGYSIAESRRGIVRSVRDVARGEDLAIRVADGTFAVRVTE